MDIYSHNKSNHSIFINTEFHETQIKIHVELIIGILIIIIKKLSCIDLFLYTALPKLLALGQKHPFSHDPEYCSQEHRDGFTDISVFCFALCPQPL